MNVTRHELRYFLLKMGFKFGRMKELCLRKENEQNSRKRGIYLKRRAEWMHAIEERKREIAEWDREMEVGHHQIRPRPRELLFLYLNESYVNKNHSIGMTWYHEDDDIGSAVNMPSGKGERLVLLTAITEEYGMLAGEEGNVLDTLLVFQAKKSTGDYHTNMNADNFCKWVEEMLFPVLKARNIEAIMVVDNASYHCTLAEGSINVNCFK